MTRMLKRAKHTIEDFDMPDVDALRDRVTDAVEVAIDRIEEALADVPSAGDASRRLRDSAAVSAATTFVVASIPSAVELLRNRYARRGVTRVASVAPRFVVAHPVLIGVTVAGGVAVGWGLARRRSRLQRERDDALLEQELRMDGEGPMPGIDLDAGEQGAGSGDPLTRRRNHSSSPSRSASVR